MKKRYQIIYVFAVLFLACVFISPAQAKPVHEEDVKPCIFVEPWITVTVTKYYSLHERINERIFVRKSGKYGHSYEGYIKQSGPIRFLGNRYEVTYHGAIPLAPGQI